MENFSNSVWMSIFLGENVQILNIIFLKLEVPSYLSEYCINSKFGVKTILLHSLTVNVWSSYYETLWVWPRLSVILFFVVFPSTHMEKKKCQMKIYEQHKARSSVTCLHLCNKLSSFYLVNIVPKPLLVICLPTVPHWVHCKQALNTFAKWMNGRWIMN